MSTKGTITQVLGAVVDVQFPADKVPEIYNAIQIDYCLLYTSDAADE